MRRLLRRVAAHEPTVLILVGALLGLATGYGAIACRLGIAGIRKLAFGEVGDITLLAREAAPGLVLFLPALGGLLVAPLVTYLAREARGHGVPEVMDAIARRGGRIRPRVALVKAAASVITIGTGGAVGWEGPIIQIGAGLGSIAGQLLHVVRRHMRILVACGAAAGIAATFNAPIAGVLFALEVFLGDLALVTFTPVVVAAVAGTAVSVLHFGSHAVFTLPTESFKLQSVWEIPLYAVLGLACACGAVLFTRLVYLVEDGFEGLRLPRLAKPALGGLAVGAIGVAMPEVLGVGYETISRTFEGGFGLAFLGALLAAKIAASCLTLGSGGSGGIFAPSLVIGAALGAVFGEVAHGLLPDATAEPGVYAVVGMAALVAGTTHAPISAILILFEMTKEFEIILPLMIACVLSTTVARGILRESIYSLKLARRGVRLRGGRDATVLQTLSVAGTMRKDATVLAEGARFDEVRRKVLASHFDIFPVVDRERRFSGIVTLNSLRPFLFEEGLVDIAVARDLAEGCGEVLAPGHTLDDARRSFARTVLGELPVVDPYTHRVVGVLREHDLHAAYNRAVERME
ncbi:MAG: chloride channel protein [Planctomycetota bacterium]|jgi:CIC family chloride channel protein